MSYALRSFSVYNFSKLFTILLFCPQYLSSQYYSERYAVIERALILYDYDKLKLTEHFKLEFEVFNHCSGKRYRQHLSLQFIPSLVQLRKEYLEPLRAFTNQPIIIGSGYRCNQLNIKVGGAYASQHTLGEAADIQIPKTPYTEWSDNKAHTDEDILNRWFEFLTTHTDFDQAIIETSNDKDFWIHISCRKNKKKNRHQIIRYLQKK